MQLPHAAHHAKGGRLLQARELIGYEEQGHVVRYHRPGLPRHGGGKRGKVVGISAGSRHRLLEKIARLKTDGHLPLFLTLTYPADFPDDDTARQHLENLFLRLQRRYKNIALLWRIEPQARGAPHFHCMVWGVNYLPAAYLRRVWASTIGYRGTVELRVGVEKIRSWRGVLRYVGKYIAKREGVQGAPPPVTLSMSHISASQPTTQGRAWGIMGADRLPWDTLTTKTWPIGPWWLQIKALAAQQYVKAGDGPGGFMLFVEQPGAWREFTEGLVYPAAA